MRRNINRSNAAFSRYDAFSGRDVFGRLTYTAQNRQDIRARIDAYKALGEAQRAVRKVKTLSAFYEALKVVHAVGGDTPGGALRMERALYQGTAALPPRLRMIARETHISSSHGGFQPPWHNTSWWESHYARYVHQIHLSTDHPGQLSYYPDAGKYERRISVAIKPGRYLTKYFGGHLDETTIREYATQLACQIKERTLHMTPVTTAENQSHVGDEWKRIYSTGPGTCMQGSSSVEVYALAGNRLRLAYFTADDQPMSNPVARCIVRDDTMQWIRAYPDDGGVAQRGLIAAMERKGYTWGSTDGIRLRQVQYNSGYVCPYIDSGDGGSQRVVVKDDHLLVGDERSSHWYDASSTSGCVGTRNDDEDDEAYTCEDCGNEVSEDDTQYTGRDRDSGPICTQCLSDNYTLAIYGRSRQSRGTLRSWFPNDECIMHEDTGAYYTREGAEEFNIAECEINGTWHSCDDMVEAHGDNDRHSKWVHIDETTGVVSNSDVSYVLCGQSVTTHDGREIPSWQSIEVEWGDGETYTLLDGDTPEDYLPELDEEPEDALSESATPGETVSPCANQPLTEEVTL